MIRLGSWVSSEKNAANEEQLVIPGILSEKSSAKSGIAVAFYFPKNVHLKPILKPNTFNQFSTINFTITLLNCFVLKSLCSKTKQLRSGMVLNCKKDIFGIFTKRRLSYIRIMTILCFVNKQKIHFLRF